MNFDEAYGHVCDGCASEEEKALVNQELQNLRRIRDILDTLPQEPVVAKADTETVMKARKQFNRKTLIRVIAIVVGSLLAIAALVCGIIFIPSCSSAAKCRVYSREEAVELARNYLAEKGEDVDELYVKDVDTRIRILGSLNNAVYVYEIEFKNEFVEYELNVSAKSGYVVLTDVDR